MKSIAICLALLAIAAIGIVVAADQSMPNGTIYGHVYDAQTKQPISGAWVYCQETKCSKQVTDSSGYYAIENYFSPSTTYTIECTKYGYKSTEVTSDTNSSGDSEVNFYLGVESAEVQITHIVYQDDFEKYAADAFPEAFMIYYNGKGDEYQIITDNESNSGSKSLQVWGAPGYCSNVHCYFELPMSSRIGYEVSVKANPKEEGWVQFVNPEGGPWSWGWGGCSFDGDGNISCPGGFKIPHKEDGWYKVRAEMDVKTGAVWVWLDDRLVSIGVTPQADGKENPEAYKGIRGVVLGDCSWHEEPPTPTYFDDLVIYTVS